MWLVLMGAASQLPEKQVIISPLIWPCLQPSYSSRIASFYSTTLVWTTPFLEYYYPYSKHLINVRITDAVGAPGIPFIGSCGCCYLSTIQLSWEACPCLFGASLAGTWVDALPHVTPGRARDNDCLGWGISKTYSHLYWDKLWGQFKLHFSLIRSR
jgi:hypothetical protein